MSFPGTLFGGANLDGIHVFSQLLSPALVAANTTAEQSLVVTAIPGFNANEIYTVIVAKPTAQAGIGIVGARVIDATHIGVTFSNNTAGGLTPTAAETYIFAVIWG